jgi:hypothetical protein
MKYLLILFLLVSVAGTAQNLNEIRAQYPEAVKSNEATSKFDLELAIINSNNTPTLRAYKGAVLTLKSKFSKKKSDKKEFFKEGVSLIEDAVKAESSNIEIRYIRLSVQENSPKFLGYHKNIEEDKGFILKNFATVSSKELKGIIKDFVLMSENFSESEKLNFK